MQKDFIKSKNTKNNIKNIFGATRLKLDLIAGVFIFLILFVFSYAIYYLLTIDIITQVSGEFRSKANEAVLFENFKQQTVFFLSLADILIFVISMLLFDRLVKKLLAPIEYFSDVQRKFAENVSHELRTPLSIISLESELLLSKINKLFKIKSEKNNNREESEKDLARENNTEPQKDLEEKVYSIQKEVKDITSLMEDLLFEARIKYEEDKEENVSVREVLDLAREVFEEEEQNINKEDKDLLISMTHDLEDLDLDKKANINKLHLKRVLSNIISNSIKYTKAGSILLNISKYTKAKKEYLSVSLKDTGIGISQSDLARVRERFYRGSNVEAHVSGTGVGLSIVEDIVDKYELEMNIESKLGKGTEVTIRNIKIR